MTGVCLAVLGGLGSWLLLGRASAEPCNGLPKNERVRKSLGATVQPDMSCAAFAEALVQATVGDESGVHSEAQAQALKDVLVTLDSGGSKAFSLDPALRVPLATALVDYAPDLHTMLGGNDGDHITKAAPDTPPWESNGTHHLAVFTKTLERTLRAIADDPHAYALLRKAETQSAARRLAAVPVDAAGYALSVPPTEGARALGILDGIADLVARSQEDQQALAWRTMVIEGILDESAPSSSSQNDPATVLVSAWLRDLKATPEDKRPDRLATQAVDMVRIWAEMRKTDGNIQGKLLKTVRESQTSGRREVAPS